MKKNALSTSLRSAIHATDSTCNGCTAKTADTKALRHNAPVMRSSATKRRTTARQCRRTLVKWCQPAFNPCSWQSSICVIVVSGCQFSEWI